MSTLKVQNIQHTNGTSGITISSGGVITLPQIPCCYVQLTTSNAQDTSNPYTTLDTDIRFDDIILNQGSCYSESTGRFTVPVAGVYEAKFMLTTSDNTTDDHNIKMYKSGVHVSSGFNAINSTYAPVTSFYLSDCAVGDYFTVRLASGDIFLNSTGILTAFSVKLVG